MDYKQIITYLFPAAICGADYVLYFPVGIQTPEIKRWNVEKLGAQPDVSMLQQAWDSVLVQQARVVQLAIITAASQAAQTAGFTSSALGAPHTYPSGLQDQANLNAVATASTFPNQPAGTTYLFWCSDASDVSGFVAHTAAQIQQVGLDALTAIMTLKGKQWELTQQIQAATTIADVQAIVW